MLEKLGSDDKEREGSIQEAGREGENSLVQNLAYLRIYTWEEGLQALT